MNESEVVKTFWTKCERTRLSLKTTENILKLLRFVLSKFNDKQRYQVFRASKYKNRDRVLVNVKTALHFLKKLSLN